MNDDLRVPELFHHLLDHAEDYRAIVVRPLPVLDHVRLRPGRPRAHDPHALPARRARRPRSSCSGRCSPAPPALWFLSEPEHDAGPRTSASAPAATGSPARASTCPTRYDPEGFRAPPRHRAAASSLRRPAGGRQGLGAAARRLRPGRGRRRPALPPRDHRARARSRRPPSIADRVIDLGFVRRRRAQRRHRRGRRLRPAVARYESFSRTIMEAWLAGHAGHRQRRQRRRALALRALRRRAALRRRRRARAVPALRGRGAGRGRGPGRRRAATTCSSTTAGRPCSTAWRRPSTQWPRPSAGATACGS